MTFEIVLPCVWIGGRNGLERVEPTLTHVWMEARWVGLNPRGNIHSIPPKRRNGSNPLGRRLREMEVLAGRGLALAEVETRTGDSGQAEEERCSGEGELRCRNRRSAG